MKKSFRLLTAVALLTCAMCFNVYAETIVTQDSYMGEKITNFKIEVSELLSKTNEVINYDGETYTTVVYTVPQGARLTFQIDKLDYPPMLTMASYKGKDWKMVERGVILSDGTYYTDGRDPGELKPNTQVFYDLKDASYGYVLGPVSPYKLNSDMPESGGETVLCFIKIAGNKNMTPVKAEEKKASVTSVNLNVAGKNIQTEAYNIDGSSYFMLRDVAMALRGTQYEFSVRYDKDADKIITTTGGSKYEATGNELKIGNKQNNATATTTTSSYMHNFVDQSANVTGYNIAGNNYYKLRDLGGIMGFDVVWNSGTKTISINLN
ncbi:hypothetical protein [Anaerotignum propionicum]|uniref:hypothetical protein n=1 Tax=Anaerotignum propionicum TaxID=28446 RepID=UPI00210EC1AE|nr:hypothetical protein [Anaerotignum propionicum]MCQ4935532.1 hypothetical protein [Anaerotignum propionicum]